MQQMKIIGRVERISFPEIGIKGVHAKIDSGADLSSLWATGIHEEKGVLHFKLFGAKSPHYTGKEIMIPSPHYLLTRIANSFGHKELRYVVKLQIKLGGKLLLATFTLSDRSRKTYPILIGRKLLKGKFLIDVGRGTPLKDIEEKKKLRLKNELEVFSMWEKKA
jgi:hypothetical protein